MGKIIKGTLFIDYKVQDKSVGYVLPDPIPYFEISQIADMPGADHADNFFQLMPIKIYGQRYLNRAMHLDRVYVKLCDFGMWGVANQKSVQHIDFTEAKQF